MSTDDYSRVYREYLRELRIYLALNGISGCIRIDESYFRSFLWPSTEERVEMGDCDE